jgi:hypothetical protein
VASFSSCCAFYPPFLSRFSHNGYRRKITKYTLMSGCSSSCKRMRNGRCWALSPSVPLPQW